MRDCGPIHFLISSIAAVSSERRGGKGRMRLKGRPVRVERFPDNLSMSHFRLLRACQQMLGLFSPYKEASDDTFAVFCQIITLFVLIVSLLQVRPFNSIQLHSNLSYIRT